MAGRRDPGRSLLATLPFYQPQIDLGTVQLTGFEVLQDGIHLQGDLLNRVVVVDRRVLG